MAENPITKAQVSEWKQDPVTRAWFTGIRRKIQIGKDYVTEGGTIDTEHGATEVKTARAVGRIEGLLDAINIDEETVEVVDG